MKTTLISLTLSILLTITFFGKDIEYLPSSLAIEFKDYDALNSFDFNNYT